MRFIQVARGSLFHAFGLVVLGFDFYGERDCESIVTLGFWVCSGGLGELRFVDGSLMNYRFKGRRSNWISIIRIAFVEVELNCYQIMFGVFSIRLIYGLRGSSVKYCCTNDSSVV